MSADEVLILAPHVRRVRDGNVLNIETSEVTLTISGADSNFDTELDRLENGVVASFPSMPASLVDILVEQKVLYAFPAQPASKMEFIEKFFMACDAWVDGIFASPFWFRFLGGQSSEKQVLAFLGQLYHRTVGADIHNLVAYERCAISEIRPLLLRHYREELGHSLLIAEGLRLCGAPGSQAVVSQPLPATRQLIEYMVATSVDSIAYLGCYGIFHAPSTVRTEDELVEQFSHFARMYPFAAPGFEAVCCHARLDYRLEHDKIALVHWLQQNGPPNGIEIAAALRGARGAAQVFRSIFDALSQLDQPDRGGGAGNSDSPFSVNLAQTAPCRARATDEQAHENDEKELPIGEQGQSGVSRDQG